jgi:protein-tyrosine-phosphatase
MCRRALAERLDCPADDLARRGVEVVSAGTMGLVGVPASTGAGETMAEQGLSLADHRSQGLSPELIQGADRIYAMCGHHQDAVLSLVPAAASRTFLLDPDGDIIDPMGGSPEDYRACARHIAQALQTRLPEVDL